MKYDPTWAMKNDPRIVSADSTKVGSYFHHLRFHRSSRHSTGQMSGKLHGSQLQIVYSSYEYVFRSKPDERVPVVDATEILLQDIKKSSKWWFRVDHQCLAILTAYHDTAYDIAYDIAYGIGE